MRTTATWVALLIILGGLFLVSERNSEWSQPINGYFADWLMANAETNPDSDGTAPVLIEINDESLEISPWTWSAMDMSLLLKALLPREPSAVVIMHTFSWLDEDDPYLRILEQYTYRTPNALMPVRLGLEAEPDYRKKAARLPALSRIHGKTGHLSDFNTVTESPPPPLMDASVQGVLNLNTEPAIIREIPLVHRFNGDVVPDMALQAFRLSKKLLPSDLIVEPGVEIVAGEGYSIPVNMQGKLRIDARHHHSIQRIPSQGILLLAEQAGNGDAGAEGKLESLRDRLIIIGRTDRDAKDIQISAVDTVSPAELTAIAVATMQAKSFIDESPVWLHLALLAFYALLALQVVPWRKRVSFTVLLLVTMGYLLSAISVFQLFNIALPAALPAFCTVFLLLTAMILNRKD